MGQHKQNLNVASILRAAKITPDDGFFEIQRKIDAAKRELRKRERARIFNG